MYIVGIDIGGTFTDLVAIDSETQENFTHKTLTTPGDPSIGVMKVVDELLHGHSISGEQVGIVIHGTTLVTNTLIERKGARTALITTKGFRDILEIGREWRYDVYDLTLEMPDPLVPRNLRLEAEERILFDGSVLAPLNVEQAQSLVDFLKSEKIDAVAVCLLHSYMNDQHEVKIKDLILHDVPQASVSLSSECIPEIREYERASTTCINAYTQPTTKNYLYQIQKGLNDHGYKRDNYFVMLSSGGITTSEVAEKFPSRIVESGPAAGAMGSSFYGELKGQNAILSFDMGGTTAKICLIEGGKPHVTNDFEVARIYRFKKGSGLPLRLPVIDMIEIGAGGGSIARTDGMGLMKVGPESAGADPGPICYDRGGEEPTVTDSDLLLGYLNPEYFLGGKMSLNLEKTKKIVKEKLADPLGVDVTRAAYGIRRVVDENMANAARIYAAEQGLDYKVFTMIAFGGQGPVHAFSIGKILGIKEMIIPAGAGVGSAFGLLVSPVRFDLVRSYVSRLQQIHLDHLNSIFEGMENEGRNLLKSAGVPEEKIKIIRSCDMRYAGQGHEISIPLPLGEFTTERLNEIYVSFEKEYERIFHRVNTGVEIEGLSWRVVAIGPRLMTDLKGVGSQMDAHPEKAFKGKRKAYSPGTDDFVDFSVYDRYGLIPGSEFAGPAIIEEVESTTVIGPGDSLQVDEYQNLIIKLGS